MIIYIIYIYIERETLRAGSKNTLVKISGCFFYRINRVFSGFAVCVNPTIVPLDSSHQIKKRWAREPKSKTARSTPFFTNRVVWAAVLCMKST